MGTGRIGFEGLSWPIRTRRASLRPVTPHDRDAVHAYRSRDDVTTYLGRGPMSPAEVDERIAENLERRSPGHPHPLLGLVIVVQDAVVGDCMVRFEPDDNGMRTAFIGYTLHPASAGQGLATEVAAALVRLCFTELGVAMVQADVFVPNLASQRVLEKVGLRRIAMTPAGSEGGGHPRMDDYLYAVTAAEWAASPSSRTTSPRAAGAGG
jgi:RimJ/RimL family protein N-acetyltransferase